MLIAATVLAAPIPMARMEWPGDLQPANNERPLAIDNVNLVTMVGGQVLKEGQHTGAMPGRVVHGPGYRQPVTKKP
jgi:hypothetical protein